MKIETKIQSQHKLRNRIKEQIRDRINERMENKFRIFKIKTKQRQICHTKQHKKFSTYLRIIYLVTQPNSKQTQTYSYTMTTVKN